MATGLEFMDSEVEYSILPQHSKINLEGVDSSYLPSIQCFSTQQIRPIFSMKNQPHLFFVLEIRMEITRLPTPELTSMVLRYQDYS